MYACEHLIGLDVPTQDYHFCDWCGEESETDVCAVCQQYYDETHAQETAHE